MNKIFKHVTNIKDGVLVSAVASEIAQGYMSKSSSTGGAVERNASIYFKLKMLCTGVLMLFYANAFALPTGGQVVDGNASLNQSGTTLTVTQKSQNATVNWTNFNVNQNETVKFDTPGANAITLNRVIGSTDIQGLVKSNGNLWFSNPNGTFQVRNGGTIQAAGDVYITDKDIKPGDYTKPTTTNNHQTVSIDGTAKISASNIKLDFSSVNTTGLLEATKGVEIKGVDVDVSNATITAVKDVIVQAENKITAKKVAIKTEGAITIGRDDYSSGALAKETDVSDASLTAEKVETSAEKLTTEGVKVKANEWLLDPTSINIVAGGSGGSTGGSLGGAQAAAGASNVTVTDLQNALNAGTNVTLVTTGAITQSAALTFNVTSGTKSVLTLDNTSGSKQAITLAAITDNSTGNSGVTLKALSDGGYIRSGGTINVKGDLTLDNTKNGTYNLSNIASTTTSTTYGGIDSVGFDLISSGDMKLYGASAGYRGVSISNATSTSGNLDIQGFSSNATTSAEAIKVMGTTISAGNNLNLYAKTASQSGAIGVQTTTLISGKKITIDAENTVIGTYPGLYLGNVTINAGGDYSVAGTSALSINAKVPTSATGINGINFGTITNNSNGGDIVMTANEKIIGTAINVAANTSGHASNILLDTTSGGKVSTITSPSVNVSAGSTSDVNLKEITSGATITSANAINLPGSVTLDNTYLSGVSGGITSANVATNVNSGTNGVVVTGAISAGDAVTIKGIANNNNGSGAGVVLSNNISSSQRNSGAALTVVGTNVGTQNGIYANANILLQSGTASNAGGNILLSGKAASAAGLYGIGTNLSITSYGADIYLGTEANPMSGSQGVGNVLSGITAKKINNVGGNLFVNATGTTSTGFSDTSLITVDGAVNIKATATTGTAVSISGAITANDGITIEGTNTTGTTAVSLGSLSNGVMTTSSGAYISTTSTTPTLLTTVDSSFVGIPELAGAVFTGSSIAGIFQATNVFPTPGFTQTANSKSYVVAFRSVDNWQKMAQINITRVGNQIFAYEAAARYVGTSTTMTNAETNASWLAGNAMTVGASGYGIQSLLLQSPTAKNDITITGNLSAAGGNNGITQSGMIIQGTNGGNIRFISNNSINQSGQVSVLSNTSGVDSEIKYDVSTGNKASNITSGWIAETIAMSNSTNKINFNAYAAGGSIFTTNTAVVGDINLDNTWGSSGSGVAPTSGFINASNASTLLTSSNYGVRADGALIAGNDVNIKAYTSVNNGLLGGLYLNAVGIYSAQKTAGGDINIDAKQLTTNTSSAIYVNTASRMQTGTSSINGGDVNIGATNSGAGAAINGTSSAALLGVQTYGGDVNLGNETTYISGGNGIYNTLSTIVARKQGGTGGNVNMYAEARNAGNAAIHESSAITADGSITMVGKNTAATPTSYTIYSTGAMTVNAGGGDIKMTALNNAAGNKSALYSTGAITQNASGGDIIFTSNNLITQTGAITVAANTSGVSSDIIYDTTSGDRTSDITNGALTITAGSTSAINFTAKSAGSKLSLKAIAVPGYINLDNTYGGVTPTSGFINSTNAPTYAQNNGYGIYLNGDLSSGIYSGSQGVKIKGVGDTANAAVYVGASNLTAETGSVNIDAINTSVSGSGALHVTGSSVTTKNGDINFTGYSNSTASGSGALTFAAPVNGSTPGNSAYLNAKGNINLTGYAATTTATSGHSGIYFANSALIATGNVTLSGSGTTFASTSNSTSAGVQFVNGAIKANGKIAFQGAKLVNNQVVADVGNFAKGGNNGVFINAAKYAYTVAAGTQNSGTYTGIVSGNGIDIFGLSSSLSGTVSQAGVRMADSIITATSGDVNIIGLNNATAATQASGISASTNLKVSATTGNLLISGSILSNGVTNLNNSGFIAYGDSVNSPMYFYAGGDMSLVGLTNTTSTVLGGSNGLYFGNTVAVSGGKMTLSGMASNQTQNAAIFSSASAYKAGGDITFNGASLQSYGGLDTTVALGVAGSSATSKKTGINLANTSALTYNSVSYNGLDSGGKISLSGTSEATTAIGYGTYISGMPLKATSGINISGVNTTTGSYGLWLGSVSLDTAGVFTAGADAIKLYGKGGVNDGIYLSGTTSLANNSTLGNTTLISEDGDTNFATSTVSITNKSTSGLMSVISKGATANISTAAGVTLTQNSNSGVILNTSTGGNLQVAKVINNGSGNVYIAAGSSLAAGVSTGGQINGVVGNTVTQASTGKTYLYSGAAAGTTNLSAIDTSVATGNNTNRMYGQAAGAGSVGIADAVGVVGSGYNTSYATGATSSNPVLQYRIDPNFNLEFTTGNLTKTYGTSDSIALTNFATNSLATASNYSITNSTTGATTSFNTTTGNYTFGYDGTSFVYGKANVSNAIISGNLGNRAQYGTVAGEQVNTTTGYAYNPLSANGLVGGTFNAVNTSNAALSLKETISKASLTISANASSTVYDNTKTYGGLSSSAGFSTNGLVNGTVDGVSLADAVESVTTTNKSGSVVGSGSVLSNAGVAQAGSFNSTLSAASGSGLSNYDITYQGVANTVSKADLTITGGSKTGTYNGSSQTNNQATFSGLQSGDSITVTGVASGQNAGTYTDNLSISGTSANNYNAVVTNGTLTINKANLSVVGDVSSNVYNGGTQTNTYTLTGAQGSDASNLVVSGSASAKHVSEGTVADNLAVTSNSSLENNYNISYTNGSLTITPTSLSVSGVADSKTYSGGTQSNGQATLSGVISGDTINVSGLASGKNVGNYADNITLSAGSNTELTDYNATITNGSLTINKANLSVIGGATTAIYDSLGKTNAFTTSGLLGSDTVTTVSGQGTGIAAGVYADSLNGASGSGLANYNISYTNGSLAIDKAALSVSSSNSTNTYNGLTQNNTVVVTGLKGSDSVSSVNGLASGKNVGTYADNLSAAAGTGLSNYNISYVNNNLAITKANLSATGSQVYNATTSFDGANLVIGGVNGETFTATGSGQLSSSSVQQNQAMSSVSGLTLSANGGASLSNYNTLGVSQMNVSVTAAALKVIGANGTVTYNGNTQNNTFSTNGLLGSDSVSSVSGLSSGKNVGTYTDNLSSAVGTGLSNYTITYVNGGLNINKANLFASGTQTYNATSNFSGSNLSVTGVNGETFAASGNGLLSSPDVSSNVKLSSVSSLTLSGNSGSLLSNYNTLNTNQTNVSVTQASLTISGNTSVKTYSGADQVNTFTTSGLLGNDTVASVSGVGTGKNVGAYNDSLSAANGTGLSNYEITYVNGGLTINKASLSVNGVTTGVTYNGATQANSGATLSGVKGSDSFTISGYGSGKNVGTYNDNLSLAGSAISNYNVTYHNGAIVVDKAGLTITGSTISSVYNGAIQTNTFDVSGLKGSDAVTSISGLSSGQNVGTYTDNLSGATGTGLSNYNIAYTNGSIDISKATLTVTGAANSVTYNSNTQSNSGATLSGVKGSDSFTISGYFSGKNVGTYTDDLSVSGSALGNYEVVKQNGSLTIDKADLLVKGALTEKVYDGQATANTVSLVGIKGSDNQSVSVSGISSGTNVGTYADNLSATGSVLSNYTVSYENGSVKITPKSATLVGAVSEKSYNGSEQTSGYTITGVLSADSSGVVVNGAAKATHVSDGIVNDQFLISGDKASNYSFTKTAGSIKITPIDLSVTGQTTSKTYSAGTQTNNVATITGLVGSDTVTVSGYGSGKNVGSYGDNLSVTLANTADYNLTVVNGSMSIEKASLSVGGITAQNKEYDATKAATLNTSGVTLTGVLGSDAISLDTTNLSGMFDSKNVGNNKSVDITGIAITGTAASNYQLAGTTATTSANVTKATLGVSGTDITTTYTGQTQSLAAPTITGLFSGDNVVVGGNASGKNAGQYDANYTISGSDAGNYRLSANTPKLVINKAQLYVTADNVGKIVTQADPTLTSTVSGFVNNETQSGIGLTYSTSRAGGETAGEYAIGLTQTSANPQNYNVNYSNGVFTVVPVGYALIKMNSASTTYGTTATPTIQSVQYGTDLNGTVVIKNLTKSNTAPGLWEDGVGGAISITPTIVISGQTYSGATVVGVYDKAVTSTNSGTTLSNGNFIDTATIKNTLTIDKANLSIAMSDVTKTYNGQSFTIAETSATASGLKNGETISGLGGVNVSGNAIGSVNAGTYAIKGDVGSGFSNYNVTVNDGTLTTNKANLSVVGASGVKVYSGSTQTNNAATVTGLVSGDAITISGYGSGKHVGSFNDNLVVTDVNTNNYTVTTTNGSLEITPASMTVVGATNEFVYTGGVQVNSGATITGLLGADTASVSGYASSTHVSEGKVNDSLSISIANPNDYNVSITNGSLKVTPATVNVIGLTKSVVYNGAEQSNGYTTSGLVGSDTVNITGSAVGKNVIVNSGAPGATTVYQDNLTVALPSTDYQLGTVTNGSLEITRASLSVVSADNTTTYSSAIQTNSPATITGLLGSDSVSVSGYGSGKNAGVYTDSLVLTGDSLTNYDTSIVNGSLTINKAGLTVNGANNTNTYSGVTQTNSGATLSGVKGSDAFTIGGYGSGKNVGTYNDNLSLSGAALSNYDVTYNNGAITLNKADLTVQGDQTTKTYTSGQLNNTYTVTGLLGSDTLTSVNGVSGGVNAASYNDNLNNASGTGLSNYNISYVNGSLTIAKAGLTISGDNIDKTYNASNQTNTYNVTGLLGIDAVSGISGVANATNAGSYADSLSNATGSGLSNYDISYVNGSLKINKATLTVNGVDNQKTYTAGIQTNSGATLSGVQGSDALTIGGYASASNVGTYTDALTVTGDAVGNYEIQVNNGQFVINKASLTVDGKTQSLVYNGATQNNDYVVTGLLGNDTVTGMSGVSNGKDVGVYNDSLNTATGSGLSNYNITYNSGTLTIDKANLVVDGKSNTSVYSANVQANSGATVTGLQGSDTFVIGGYGSGTNVGVYNDNLSLTGSGLSNYNVTYNNGKIELTKATLSVTGANASKTYESSELVNTYSVTGLLGSDSITSVNGIAKGTNVGVYNDNLSGASGTGLSNYEIAYTNGGLTINKASLVVNGVNNENTYTATTQTNSGATVSGIKGSDTFTISGYGSGKDVGTYNDDLSVTGTKLSNYDVTYNNGSIKLNKASLGITGNTTETVYSSSNSVNGYTVTGLLGDDAVSDVAGKAAGKNAGLYLDDLNSASGTGLSNYAISYTNGSLSIAKADLSVSGSNDSVTYNASTQTRTGFSQTGLQGSDSISVSGYGSGKNVGVYNDSLSVTGAELSNYNLTITNGSLSIAKADLVVNGQSNAATYNGATQTNVGATLGGVKGSDTFTISGYGAGKNVGTYNDDLSVSGTALSNYNVTCNNGSLTLNKAQLSITGGNLETTYNSTTQTNTYSVSGLLGSDTVDGLSGIASGKSAGVYSDTLNSANGVGLSNYEISYTNGGIKINKADLVVNGSSLSKVYNGVMQNNNAAVVSGVQGTDVITVSGVSSGKNVGTYNDDISLSGNELSNYNIQINNGSIEITKAAITVTGQDNAVVYNATTQTNSGATVSGIKGVDTFTISGYGSGKDVGTYNDDLSLSGTALNNYDITYVNGGLTINKANLTIQGNSTSVTYNAGTQNNTFNTNGLKGDDSVVSVSGLSGGRNVGIYDDSLSNADGVGLSNYNITYQNGSIEIGKANLVLKGVDTTTTYNGSVQDNAKASIQGIQGADVFTVSGEVSAKNAGSHTDNLVASGDELANYNVTAENGTLTINKAALTATANSSTVTYNGVAQSVSGFTVSGLKGTDTIADLVNTSDSGATAKNAGTYKNTMYAGVEQNYTITAVDGSLNIDKASLTATANSTNVTYNGADQSLSGFTVDGLKGSDTVADLVNTSASGITAKNAGVYTNTMSTGEEQNYVVTTVDGTLSIAKAGLTATGNSSSVTYNGGNQSVSGFTVNGLKGTDTIDDLVNTTAAGVTAKNAGAYSNVMSTGVEQNYIVSTVDGTLNIDKASLTATAKSSSVTYNGVNQSVSGFSVSGLKGADTVGDLVNTSASGVTAKNAGSYINTMSTGVEQNYVVTTVDGNLNIEKAALTATANSSNVTYSGVNQSVSGFTVNGLKGDDTINDLVNTTASGVTAKNVGIYTNNMTTGDEQNYVVTTVDGALTISKANLVATGNSSNVTYNGVNQSVAGFTVSGLKGSDTVEDLVNVSASGATGKNVGAYTNAVTTGVEQNYNVTAVDGSLNVDKAVLIVNGGTKQTIYNATVQKSENPTILGIQGADEFSLIGQAEGKNVGTYNDAYEISGSSLSNYSVEINNGKLIVDKAKLAVVGDVKEVSFNGKPNENTYVVSGLQGSDEVVVSGMAKIEVGKASDALHVEQGSDTLLSNYDVTVVNGVLTIRGGDKPSPMPLTPPENKIDVTPKEFKVEVGYIKVNTNKTEKVVLEFEEDSLTLTKSSVALMGAVKEIGVCNIQITGGDSGKVDSLKEKRAAVVKEMTSGAGCQNTK